MKRFDGKIALITGAGSRRGIGRATALALAREGAKICITDIVPESVKSVVAELNEISQAIGEVADVRNKAQMVQVVKKTTDTFGGLDILVNVAGLTRPTRAIASKFGEGDRIGAKNGRGWDGRKRTARPGNDFCSGGGPTY
jgi:NAD(P)-dependent dehydrogenase (short-subunit alcohol dehydrogenase family)